MSEATTVRVRLRDGLELNVRERGRGPALVLLHGFTGSSEAWGETVLRGLARCGRVLAPDAIGHGESDRPQRAERYAAPQWARDVGELLRARAAQPAILIGYSMGARAALAVAALAPELVRGLVLEGGSPGLASEEERRARRASDAALADRLERDGIEPFVRAWEQLPLFATQRRLGPETLREQRRRRLANDPRALAACLRGFGTGSQPSFWARLPELRMPVLLMAGELDAKFRDIALAMEHALPLARRAIVPGAGHATHLESPQTYLDALRRFIELLARERDRLESLRTAPAPAAPNPEGALR